MATKKNDYVTNNRTTIDPQTGRLVTSAIRSGGNVPTQSGEKPQATEQVTLRSSADPKRQGITSSSSYASRPGATGSPYTGLPGVSEGTAAQMGRYQQDYRQSDQASKMQRQMEKHNQDYAASQAVTNAQMRLAEWEQNKPGDYQGKYTQQLDDILAKISNPGKFNYEFNGDSLFNQYADMYQQRGRQASMDAQGQAAALTGGYGNSYAQQVGNQAYQQYLTGLYDKGLEFRDRAYQEYQDQLARDRDLYGILAQQDQTDYGRYRDTVGDWYTDRNYLTDRYDTERNFDYNQYLQDRDYYTNLYNTERNFDYNQFINNRDYWTGLAQIENQDYRSDQDRQEAIRQYNEQFAYQQYLDQLKLQMADAGATGSSGGGGGGGGNKRQRQESEGTNPLVRGLNTGVSIYAGQNPLAVGLTSGIQDAVKNKKKK